MLLEEDERGSYILNAKDLCLMPRLNEYLALGINSLKVEGRNRSAYYVAVTAHAYRMAIDDWRSRSRELAARRLYARAGDDPEPRLLPRLSRRPSEPSRAQFRGHAHAFGLGISRA